MHHPSARARHRRPPGAHRAQPHGVAFRSPRTRAPQVSPGGSGAGLAGLHRMEHLVRNPALGTFRRVGGVAAAGGLLAGAALAAAPGASAAPATAVDCSTTNLQTAIDNASPGATLAVTGTCFGSYTIDQNLTLVGQGTAVLDGQNSYTTLTVSSGATVGVRKLTITGGNAGTGSAGDGGGINNSGTLTLDQSTVSNSAASSYGGGIYNSATLTLNQTTVSGNNGSVFGGGIYNNGAMTVEASKISQNSAGSGGGGIFTGFGFSPVTVTDSMVIGNTATAGSGGGIFNILDNETLANTTVKGNTAALEGGGINNNAGTTTLDNSAVTNNTAQQGESGYYGGGIFDFSGTVPLNDSSVRSNTPDNCDPSGYVSGCTG
jgi:hypothetical protein